MDVLTWQAGTIAIASAIAVTKALTRLSLSSNVVGDKGAAALADAMKASDAVFVRLDLENCKVTL